ncbi:hypothetical protein RCL1_001141 [Eukaryota sp. TZLM3-RCL]
MNIQACLADALVVETAIHCDPDSHLYIKHLSHLSICIKESNYSKFLGTCESIFPHASVPIQLGILSCFSSFLQHSPLLFDAIQEVFIRLCHGIPASSWETSVLTRFILLTPKLFSHFIPVFLDFLVSFAFPSSLDNQNWQFIIRILARDTLLVILQNLNNYDEILDYFFTETRSLTSNIELLVFFLTFLSTLDFSKISTNLLTKILNLCGKILISRSFINVGSKILNIRCFQILKHLLLFSIEIMPFSVFSFVDSILLEILNPENFDRKNDCLSSIFDLFLYLSDPDFSFFYSLFVIDHFPFIPNLFQEKLLKILTNLQGQKIFSTKISLIISQIFNQISKNFDLNFSDSTTVLSVAQINSFKSITFEPVRLNDFVGLSQNWGKITSSFPFLSLNFGTFLSFCSLFSTNCTSGTFLTTSGNEKFGLEYSKSVINWITSLPTYDCNFELDFWTTLSSFLLLIPSLPSEAQMIDRFLEYFANSLIPFKFNLTVDNQRLFVDGIDDVTIDWSNVLHVLAFASLMLHTDLHNPSIQSKMSVELFSTLLSQSIPVEIFTKNSFNLLHNLVKVKPIPPAVINELNSPKNSNKMSRNVNLKRLLSVCSVFDTNITNIWSKFLKIDCFSPSKESVYVMVVDVLMTLAQNSDWSSLFLSLFDHLVSLQSNEATDKAIFVLIELISKNLDKNLEKNLDSKSDELLAKLIDVCQSNSRLIRDSMSTLLSFLIDQLKKRSYFDCSIKICSLLTLADVTILKKSINQISESDPVTVLLILSKMIGQAQPQFLLDFWSTLHNSLSSAISSSIEEQILVEIFENLTLSFSHNFEKFPSFFIEDFSFSFSLLVSKISAVMAQNSLTLIDSLLNIVSNFCKTLTMTNELSPILLVVLKFFTCLLEFYPKYENTVASLVVKYFTYDHSNFSMEFWSALLSLCSKLVYSEFYFQILDHFPKFSFLPMSFLSKIFTTLVSSFHVSDASIRRKSRDVALQILSSIDPIDFCCSYSLLFSLYIDSITTPIKGFECNFIVPLYVRPVLDFLSRGNEAISLISKVLETFSLSLCNLFPSLVDVSIREEFKTTLKGHLENIEQMCLLICTDDVFQTSISLLLNVLQ